MARRGGVSFPGLTGESITPDVFENDSMTIVINTKSMQYQILDK